MAENPWFKESLSYLVKLHNNGEAFSLLCAEQDPMCCHRSRLIGRELYFNFNINTDHIIDINKSVNQIDLMVKLTKNQWNPYGDLFGEFENPYFKSCKPFGKLKQDE